MLESLFWLVLMISFSVISIRSSKPVTRVFSDETKLVIYHLQEALLDIIDLNLCQEELKVAVSDYLAELLEAGPAYLEVEKCPDKHWSPSNPGKVSKQADFSLKQCPPQQSTKSRLNFPFTGQDPRISVMQEDATMYKSHKNLPSKSSVTPPHTVSTPKSNLRYRSDPVTRAYQQPQADYNKQAFSQGAELSHPEQTFNMTRRGDSVRRNLFSTKQADCYRRNEKSNPVSFIQSPYQDPKKDTHVMSDYIEEFEKYIQHKYSSPECIRLNDTDNQEAHSPLSSGDEEMPNCEIRSSDSTESSGTDDNSPKRNVFHCPPSRFELFLQKSSLKMESPTEVPLLSRNTPPEPCQAFESCEKEAEDQDSFTSSRFERFLRNYEAPQVNSDSAESMTEEEFYRELLRIRTPKKSC